MYQSLGGYTWRPCMLRLYSHSKCRHGYRTAWTAHTGGASANLLQSWKTGSFSEENIRLSHNSKISFLDTSPGEVRTELQKDLQSNVYCSLISHGSNLETTPKGKCRPRATRSQQEAPQIIFSKRKQIKNWAMVPLMWRSRRGEFLLCSQKPQQSSNWGKGGADSKGKRTWGLGS